MHTLMLITLTMSADATSKDARDEAYSRLVFDPSFCGEGGRFGCPLADWFVLGGRWSGHLRESLLGDAYKEALEKRGQQLTKDSVSLDRPELHKDGLNQLWERFGGTGSHPSGRNSYLEHGYEDDAMLVDQTLYDRFLKPLAGTDAYFHDESLPDFADLDGDEVDESFIGRKWLVVVDYHC